MSELSLQWLVEARKVLDHFETTQDQYIDQAAHVCMEAINAGRLVHLFGTGHSRIPVEEMFPRHGSYPGFVPVVEHSVTSFTDVTGTNGLRQAMYLERAEGFGTLIADSVDIREGDVVIVFSVSGTNAVPVEFAKRAGERGASVIAVTNRESLSSGSISIADLAELTIDLGIPPLDAAVDIPGWSAPIAPLSTVAYACAVNLLRIRTAELLTQRGVKLPVIAHSIQVGTERAVQAIDEVCSEHERRVRRGPDRSR